MKLRKVSLKDARFIYNLRNNFENRFNSLNTGFISYKSHEKWFKKALVKEDIYKINFKKKDCGYIRLTKKNTIYFVSICVNKKFRKKNIASLSLNSIENKIPYYSELRAIVKKSNLASKKLFLGVGYRIFQKNKKFLIMRKNKNKLKVIDKIETVRSKNNANWMDILRLAYKNSPNEAASIMSKIYKDDSKISKLVKKLIK